MLTPNYDTYKMLEILSKGKSVIVFSPTKEESTHFAQKVRDYLGKKNVDFKSYSTTRIMHFTNKGKLVIRTYEPQSFDVTMRGLRDHVVMLLPDLMDQIRIVHLHWINANNNNYESGLETYQEP